MRLLLLCPSAAEEEGGRVGWFGELGGGMRFRPFVVLALKDRRAVCERLKRDVSSRSVIQDSFGKGGRIVHLMPYAYVRPVNVVVRIICSTPCLTQQHTRTLFFRSSTQRANYFGNPQSSTLAIRPIRRWLRRRRWLHRRGALGSVS